VKRLLAISLLAAAVLWVGWGLSLRGGAAHDSAAAAVPGELRGAWHVHTTASDGRAPLEAVVRAAREAGLQFVVVTDHNVRVPAAPEYRDGVLVIPGTEISSPVGHVVAVGVARALTATEKDGSPFDAVAALGGHAVIAHPMHPRRPFRGDWADPRIAGVEPVSNDSFWGKTLAGRRAGAFAVAALAVPWDGARTVLELYGDPEEELRRYDALADAARVAGREPPAFLCSADAHGWPSYRAAFLAFSMHVPVTPTGDAGRDATAVVEALLGRSAVCVFDAVAPGWKVALSASGPPGARTLQLVAPFAGAEVRVVRDGKLVRSTAQAASGRTALCGGDGPPCVAGTWRAEARIGARPWIFTNPVVIE
jgi:predicted metal-dependent phosphoesterase TrpH